MRRRTAEKRQITPDRKYGSILISKMINKIMLDGKKSIAENILYTAMENGAKKENVTPIDFFNKVLENVGPKKKISLRRFGGNTYSVPREVKSEERPLRAIFILVQTMRDISFTQGKKAASVLEDILIQSYQNNGAAVSAKEKIHKTAEANAAFAHFQW